MIELEGSTNPKESQFDIQWGNTKESYSPTKSFRRMSSRRNKKHWYRDTEKLKKILPIAGLVFLFILFFVILPIQSMRKSLSVVNQRVKELKQTASENDIDKIQKSYDELGKSYEDFRKDASKLYWLSLIPYVSDMKNGVEAGHFGLVAGKDAIVAIAPYADLLGFKKGGTSFVEKSAEDRLQTAVLTLDKMLGKIDGISANIKEAENRIDKIDPNRYPEYFGKTPVRSRIANIKEQFYGVSSLFVDAKPLLKNLPTILGKDKEQTYLILFQNNYERRATGGFLTAYAFFTIKDGRMKIERSEDIYSMDAAIANHPAAPREIASYHKGVYQFYIRDSNLSPDLPESIKLFESLYNKSSAKSSYDGVIMLDAKVLVDMLKIYGDTDADGVRFSANLDKRCDCPQVIYTLFDIVDRPVNYVKTDRKGILGDLMYALFYKALGFSPSKYWGTLAQTMYTNLEEKHILMNFKDPKLQSSVENVNFGGRIREFDGDYLHVNNVNFAGAKSNLYVKEEIESKSNVVNGKIQKTVTVTYTNPYSHSDCNLERGGLCLNAVLRNWVRVYVPENSKLVSFKGSQTNVKTYNDLKKTVFEGFLTVNPEGRAQIIVTYELPATITTSNYTYMIQKQPGTEQQELKVFFNNGLQYDKPFSKDVVLKGSL